MRAMSQKLRYLSKLFVLALLTFSFVANTSAQETVYFYNGDDGYSFSVTYDGRSFDGTNTTFSYTARVLVGYRGLGFSHITFGVQPCRPGLNVLSCSPTSGAECYLNTDPTTGVYGVKWNFDLSGVGSSQSFAYTLAGNVSEAANVSPVTIKAGSCIAPKSFSAMSSEEVAKNAKKLERRLKRKIRQLRKRRASSADSKRSKRKIHKRIKKVRKELIELKAVGAQGGGRRYCEIQLMSGPSCEQPTPTPTNTATSTATATNTATNTPTNTPTNTATNTATSTPTNTATSTPTSTATTTPTATATPTTPTDLPPNCDAGGPYLNLECNAENVSVQLDGSNSSDPDGGDLSFNWTSDCPGAAFDDFTSSTPVLSFSTTNEDGTPTACEVILAIAGLEVVESCKGTVTVDDCLVDCLGEINGTATYDECGVCNGDGTSCQCVTVNYDLNTLAETANKQKKLLRQWRRENRRNCGKKRGKKARKEGRQLLKQLSEHQTALGSFPQSVEICNNEENCVSTDNSSFIEEYAATSQAIDEVVKKLVKQRKRCGKGDGVCTSKSAKRCLKRIRKRNRYYSSAQRQAGELNSETQNNLSTVPNPLVNCS